MDYLPVSVDVWLALQIDPRLGAIFTLPKAITPKLNAPEARIHIYSDLSLTNIQRK